MCHQLHWGRGTAAVGILLGRLHVLVPISKSPPAQHLRRPDLPGRAYRARSVKQLFQILELDMCHQRECYVQQRSHAIQWVSSDDGLY